MCKRETIWLGYLDFLESSWNLGLLGFNSALSSPGVATIITNALMLIPQSPYVRDLHLHSPRPTQRLVPAQEVEF